MAQAAKSRLFVGCVSKNLTVAVLLQTRLEHDLEVTVWNQGPFREPRLLLLKLLEKSDQFDFAAFVFAPDDKVEKAGKLKWAVRDNVLFELGLFMGKLGLAPAANAKKDWMLRMPKKPRGTPRSSMDPSTQVQRKPRFKGKLRMNGFRRTSWNSEGESLKARDDQVLLLVCHRWS